MRYIITQTQFHSLVYNYLNQMFSKKDFRKETNPYVKDGNTWNIDMFDDKGKELMSYYWYGPGEYDDGTPHNGVGSLQIHHQIVNSLRKMLSVRGNRILDIVADWVSETLDVDVDEIDIYPKGESQSY